MRSILLSVCGLIALSLSLAAGLILLNTVHAEPRGNSVDENKPPLRVALLTQSAGYTHGVVKPRGDKPSRVEATWRQIVADSDDAMTLTVLKDVTELPDRLDQIDLLVMYTTGDLPLNERQFAAFERWLRDGGGLLGIHPATDTWKNDDRWAEIIGGIFDGHPWGAGDTVTLKVLDAEHPTTAHLDASLTIKEEIYQFRDFDPEPVRVLIGLDMERTAKKRPYFVPVAWCRLLDDGRVYYTSLGHRDDVWTADWYQTHLTQAALWAGGRIEGDATPNPKVAAAEQRAAEAAADR